MDRFRAGEAMLRSTHSLWSFSAPAKHQRIAQPVTRHCRGARDIALRTFTTTQYRRQEEAPRPPQNTSSATDEISSLLDSTLDLDKGSPGVSPSRTSTFKSRSAQSTNSPSRSIAERLQQARSDSGSSLDDILNIMVKSQTTPPKVSQYTGTSISDIFSGTSFTQPGPSEREQRASEPARMPPNVGRLVQIDSARDMDVGRAFKTMEALCGRNKIRSQFMRQRFHERPGMKRKRLKRERWTKRFKANFKATVAMVQRMKKQGW